MLSKICKKTVTAEHGKGKPVSPKTHPKYNHATKACKEETGAAGDLRHKSKEMSQPSITGALVGVHMTRRANSG